LSSTPLQTTNGTVSFPGIGAMQEYDLMKQWEKEPSLKDEFTPPPPIFLQYDLNFTINESNIYYSDTKDELTKEYSIEEQKQFTVNYPGGT
jgi:hypothetical protein